MVQTFEVGMILHSFLKLIFIFELNRNEKELIKTAFSIYFLKYNLRIKVFMSPWRNRLARSAVTSTLATERLVVRAHPGTKVLRSFFSAQIATKPELLYDIEV